jgi:hypothetical protein
MDRPTPRADDSTRPADVPRRRREWEPQRRNRLALDRYILETYGEDVAREYGISRRRR